MKVRAEVAQAGPARPVRRPNLFPYFLAAPAALYVGLLILYPIGQGVATSFTQTELLSALPPRWIGLANYQRMLSDAGFWRAVGTTLWYTFLVVTTVMLAALLTALLMNNRFRGRWLARGVITLPWAFPEVAAVLIWTWIFSQQFGVLNVFARWLLPIPDNLPWLTDPNLAMFSLILMTLWKIFPFYSLILLTALQSVEPELYEAAKIDGAGPLQSFRYVTLPGIAPTLGILTLLITIWSFRRFTTIYLLTGGGPAAATETLVIRVYNTAFKFWDLSYGATLGVAGLALSLAITTLYFVGQRRRAGGEV
ncbi:MAG: sugar ABC transporter permease [Chloroflexi bacterium]|nr:sugar ABC transporter permease [Chloroflexota bacterium]